MCQSAANNSKRNNGEEEGADACEHSGWAGEAWSALFFLKAGKMASSLVVWRDCHTTLHVSLPPDRGHFFLSFFFLATTDGNNSPPFFLLMNVQKVTVKKGLVCLYFFLFPHSAVCICQGASVRLRGLKRLGSSFVLYAHGEKGTKMEHQAKGVILQQEKDLTCWFVHISAWLQR